MKIEESEEYWDSVALEAKNKEALKVKKWKRVARNWLAEYADKRANDFLFDVVENVIALPSSAKVLDVGCGPGKWTRYFAKSCSRVTAVDVSSEMIMLAKESVFKEGLTNVDFHVMNVSELSFPSNSYDLVNCVTVLQHILDDDAWKKAVKNMIRVTKQCGKILLFETAPDFVIKKRTPHMRVTSMKHYIKEFENAEARLIYWRAADLSLPITFFGLRNYAASFNKRVYYFLAGKSPQFSADFLSLLSRIAVVLAEPIDYRFGRTPLGLLSFARIMLFEKNA